MVSIKMVRKRSHNSCYYDIKYHLVLVSKYRKKCFDNEMLLFLEKEFKRILEGQDCKLIEFGGEKDHVHMLITLHPTITPSAIINSMKTVSSRLLKKTFSEKLKDSYWGTNAIWNRSYCLLTVGNTNEEVIKNYIKNQNKPL